MQPYVYKPLAHDKSSLRLLKLVAGSHSQIQCELLHASPQDDTRKPYEALSYVWGSAELVESIVVDNKELWITDNLHAALQYLRLPDKDRYLWVDAICINQDDKHEQGRQVREMGSIYGKAERVIFWLGKATPEIALLMDVLNQLEELAAAYALRTHQWDAVQALAKAGTTNGFGLNIRDGRVLIGQLGDDGALLAEVGLGMDVKQPPMSVQDIDAAFSKGRIRDFVKDGSKTREPAVEPNEQRLARAVDVGASSILKPEDWQELWLAIINADAVDATVRRNIRTRSQQGILQLLRRPWFTRVWILQEVANAQAAVVCSSSCAVPAYLFSVCPSLLDVELPPSCKPILDIMPGPCRPIYWRWRDRDLHALLKSFRHSKATDERDKIYALLDLSIAQDDRNAIEIDYTVPVSQVLGKTVKHLIATTEVGVHEVLDVMDTFVSLTTVYFMPSTQSALATEEIWPEAKRGRSLGPETVPWTTTEAIVAVRDASLFLVEDLGEQTCHQQVLRLMSTSQAAGISRTGVTKPGIRVFRWGPTESNVKIVYVDNPKEAVLYAAQHDLDTVVRQLLRIDMRSDLQDGNWVLPTLRAASRLKDKRVASLILGTALDLELPSFAEAAKDEQHNKQIGIVTQDTYASDQTASTNDDSLSSREHLVRLLLDRIINIEPYRELLSEQARDDADRSQLHFLRLLIGRKSDDIATSKGHGTALQVAAREGDLPMVRQLLSFGANVDAHGGLHASPLMLASRRGSVNVVKLLLQHGADVNLQANRGECALFTAVMKQHIEIVKILLAAGARTDLRYSWKTYGGERLLQRATRLQNREMVEILLDAGADIDGRPWTVAEYCGTALEEACALGDLEMVQYLISRNADVNAPRSPRLGGTALQLASTKERLDMLRLLLFHGATVPLVATLSKHDSPVSKLLRLAYKSHSRWVCFVCKEKQRSIAWFWHCGNCELDVCESCKLGGNACPGKHVLSRRNLLYDVI